MTTETSSYAALEDGSTEKSSIVAKFVRDCLPGHFPRVLGWANFLCLARKAIVGKYLLQTEQERLA